MNRTPDVVACFACLHEKGIRREEIMSTPRKKIARIAKVAYTSVLEVSVPSVFSILSDLSVVFFSRFGCQISSPKWPTRRVSMIGFVRKLVIVHKHVVGRLIPYNLELACVRKLEAICPDVRALPRRSLWMATSWMNHSVRKVGVEYRAAWRLEMS